MPNRTGATPIIWENTIFLNVADGDDLFAWAVDKRTGEPLWKKPIAAATTKSTSRTCPRLRR